MSGRFVRASKFRHVHGEDTRKDKCYVGLKNPYTNGDGDFITGNTKFVAWAISGGGGPIIVHNREKIGRLASTPFHINVHKANVLDLAFNPFMENMIATGSDDCHARVTIFPEEGLTEHITNHAVELVGHQKKVSLLRWHPTASNVLATVSYDHTVKVWDVEAQAEMFSYECPEVAVSLAWNSDGSKVATTTKDKKLRIYDPRVGADSAVEAANFEGSKPAKVVWADNHDALISVGFTKTSQRQAKLWDERKLSEPTATLDIDQSAGVLIPFYDPDTSILFLGGKGDGNIRFFELAEGNLHYLSEFRSSESQKGLGFLPKRACDVSTCEIALAVRLMRDYIQPVHFQVPRKSDLFQEDIYPEAYAGVPAMTAAEWSGGKNAPPVKRSMKPGTEGPKGAKVEFKAQKSPAELKAELDAAYKKIAELEKKLAEK